MAVNPKVTYNSARALGCLMLARINMTVTELLDEMGITDPYLNEKLREGLGATKVISVVPIPPKGLKPSTGDLPGANEKSIEFIDVPDANVRVKYLDMAYKLKGNYAAEKKEHVGEITVISAVPEHKNAG